MRWPRVVEGEALVVIVRRGRDIPVRSNINFNVIPLVVCIRGPKIGDPATIPGPEEAAGRLRRPSPETPEAPRTGDSSATTSEMVRGATRGVSARCKPPSGLEERNDPNVSAPAQSRLRGARAGAATPGERRGIREKAPKRTRSPGWICPRESSWRPPRRDGRRGRGHDRRAVRSERVRRGNSDMGLAVVTQQWR